MTSVWMKPPFGVGAPKEVEATPEILTPLMVAGWSQTEPPARTPVKNKEVTERVDN